MKLENVTTADATLTTALDPTLDMTRFTDCRVIKRNGKLAAFDPQRIAMAMTKAFMAVEQGEQGEMPESVPSRIQETTETLTQQVITDLSRRLEFNGTVHIEDIQDQVELELMRGGEHKVARHYVLYREQHAQQRASQPSRTSALQVSKADDSLMPLDETRLYEIVEEACLNLEDVDPELVISESLKNLFDGIQDNEVNRVLVMVTRMLIEKEPNYTYVAARLLLDTLRTEALSTVGNQYMPTIATAKDMQSLYAEYFACYIKKGIEFELLAPILGEFDIQRLAEAIKPERDFKFTYLGFQTLYDRYFLHHEDVRFELPQAFFMRVAMGLSLNEVDREARAIEFYNLLSSFDFMSSTPTLFNSGTNRSQMSSCYLTTIPDDLDGIFSAIKDNALLSKFAGGLGNDWTPVRSMGARIKGTNGKSQGVIPFLKVANDTLLACNQGGKRKGSGCAYLETWHLDIEEFLELRKNTGDERRRTHDMNTATWIPDEMMVRIHKNMEWTLFSPDETPDLHELYGADFEKAYLQYEEKAALGQMKLYKKVSAVQLWRKMLTMIYETGHPWITFKDACNVRSPQQHVGVVHSSNLCCIAADQRVVTDRGMLTIGELYQQGGKNKVMGLDGVYNASKMLLPRPNAPMLEIQTLQGYTHKVTPDHKVWVQDQGWVEAQNLQEGDKLLIQQLEGLWGAKDNSELSYLMGLIAGEGTFGPSNVPIDIWAHDYRHLDEITETVHYLLEGNTVLKTTSTNTPTFRLATEHKRARLSSAPLRRLLRDEGFTPETKTQVPDLIWQGNKATVSAYLRGLYQADGHIQTGDDITTLVLASKNLKFIQDLQIIWANFGVKTAINKMRDHQLQTLPDGRGGKKAYWSKPLYRLLITSIKGCQIAEKIIQFSKVKDVQKPAIQRFFNNLKKTGYQQKMYSTFSKTVALPNEDAYCLMVDSVTHAWTVNGMITKNTEITLNTSEEEIAVCFPAGTSVLTAKGQLPIEQCDNEIVLVPFSDKLSKQHKFQSAKLIDQGLKEVFKVQTLNGIYIEATGDHPFLVQHPVDRAKPKVYEWRKLKELNINDFIVCPLTDNINPNGNNTRDDEFTAAGWMLGDGWMVEGGYGACFAPADIYAQEFVIPILNRWHQESELGKNAPHSKHPTPYTQKNGVVNWQSQRKGFIDNLKKRFGFKVMKSAKKVISSQIKTAKPEQISSFLSGLFSADGCVTVDKNKQKGGVCLSLSSASKALLLDVQLLLKPFGVHGRVRGGHIDGRNAEWQGQLDIRDSGSIRNFVSFIGFSLSPLKKTKLMKVLSMLTSKSGFQHSAVVSIESCGLKQVYDLSLQEDHNFVANGLVVHNCNLGSINLPAHIDENGLNTKKLARTIKTAMRMLDNVIDINYYSVPQARKSNLRHRPIGMGLMGFQDALYQLRLPYSSDEAVEFADKTMEEISYQAISSSCDLAEERGKYASFDGSLWSKGILPIDSLADLKALRGDAYLQLNDAQTLDWDSLRKRVKTAGMRNSNCMAIAPTACVTGDSLILSSQGLIPIESLAESKAQWQDIEMNIAQEGNLALSNKLYLNGLKDTLRITTKRGSEITATPNHRVRVIDEQGHYVWRYFADLQIGDEVVRRLGGHQALLADKPLLDLIIPQKNHFNQKQIDLPTQLDESVAFLIGLYMGDGYLKYSHRGHYDKKEGLGLAIHDDEIDLLQFLRDSFKQWGVTLLSDLSKTDSACTSHLVFSSQLVEWFKLNQFNKQRGHFGEGSASAFIPQKVLQSNSQVLCAFLSGLFVADGTASDRHVAMATVSRQLAKQVKVSLESLGILATLSTSKAGTKGNRPVHRVRTSNIEATQKFLQIIGFGQSLKQQKLIDNLQIHSLQSDQQRGHNIHNQAVIVDFIQTARAMKVDANLLNAIACAKTNGALPINLARKAIAAYPALQHNKLGKLLAKGDLYFEPIVKIEASQDVTYDLQVPENHTYIANGFISHNTISNICGVTQSIEPTYQNLFVKSNLSGEFTVVNPYLVADLKALNLWDETMVNDLKYFDGSVQAIDRVPDEIKALYTTAFEIDPSCLVEAAARRQKWIDQAQSLNLYMAEPSGKSLDKLYKLAWLRGLKTTYYLRSLGATHVEKNTVLSASNGGENTLPKACAIDDPECEACQ